ncbi:amino acid adenylation domain-containing protein [Inquilinus sp. OTU3971]|uniref:amino acid adenylation domain-containing protein n=1 Tax=Inquilinus sp. OTU3971 TaxID=3043855 RepID=UPI00313B355D
MANDTAPRLSRETVEWIYPLRPLQQGMLFHELSTPEAPPYFRQVSFTIDGAFDPALCEATWNQLMERHELLRSAFDYETTSQPLQIVLKRQTVEFGFEDLEGADAAARILAWRRADESRGFDLRHDRLMRVQLFRLGPDRFEMIWSHPHILLDGWSGAILFDEFARIYAAARSGRSPDLPAPPDPGDYLAALADRDPVATRRHWATLLAEYDELATLPRPAHRRALPQPAMHRFRIGERETAAATALAARSGVTLGTVLQALWGILLGRWVDRRDVIFGTVVSGRSVAIPGVERLVGCFINTVPVRVCLSRRQSFAELLQVLQRQALEGLAHDHAGLAEIQAASALPHGLLDHLLVFENYPAAEDRMADAGFRVAMAESLEQANYDFGVMVHAGAALDVTLPYDAAVFAPARMRQIEAQLRALVTQVLADPDRPVDDLDMLGAEERQALEAGAAGPAVPWPETATLVDLWHAQVDRTPDAVAVSAGDERLSYRELDRAADGVGRRLLADGLAAEEVVGVLADRGIGRIVALLGILKAGGVYLPLSPAFPDGRIGFMLDDTGCRQVLTDGAGSARLAALRPGVARPVAGVAAAGERLGGASPQSLAYIIFTSGSTGRPKGVAVEHRGFVNMILAQIAGFGVGPGDAVVQFASCSFDASLSEIFMALLAGARLVLAPEATIRDGARLLALMAAERVTVATLPPSYLRALDGADLGGLRVLITAGEPPDERDARHYARRLRYFNAYGPSEASVCASWHEVDPEAAYPDGIPIGRPIANTRMMVLDGAGRAMPVGAVGEICLAGPGLARGYFGRPDLSAERFVELDGRRVYRTGDAGLVQPDGAVVYLGRRDSQVKFHGYRVELGEIESLLRGHPAVAQATAVVRDEPKRIVAYIVPRGAVDPVALRHDLAAELPPWMVPAAVVPLSELPRTVAGKIDRNALPAPERQSAVDEAPMTPAEAAVAEAFAAVLGSGPVGRHGSFAESGGDSLRAIQLLARLRRDGFVLDLRDLLAADTVAAVAAVAATAEAGGDDRPVTGALPLTPIQRWLFGAHSRGFEHLNHLVLLHAATLLDREALAAALDAVWRHHDALRLRCRQDAGVWVQEIAAPEPGPGVQEVDLRHLADPWPTLVAEASALQAGFDLGRGPLFKAVHYRLPEGDHLLLTAHHLVVDAVSWRFILEDLFSGLRQATAGKAIHLPGKTTSYRAWATALDSWSRSAAIEAERPYWARIDGAAVPPLPTDAPKVEHGYAETETMTLDLDAMPSGVPDTRIVARLLAALADALHGWDGRRLARVLLSSHGRNPPMPGIDPSRTVGWFTADFPFLIDCPGGAAAVQAIEAALASVPSKGLGWGVLRRLSPSPIGGAEAELSLNYLGVAVPELDPAFRLSDRLPNASIGTMERRRLIELEAWVAAGRLRLGLRYAPGIHAPATIRALAQRLAASFAAGSSPEGKRSRLER